MDTPGTQPRWWHGATLYQIYVRSWQDTNDDGYGDLNGVTAHLDYLSWLGVDGIWLSPTMPSPDDDWGYDVSDYMGVHPELGTLADLDRLVAEAGLRDLRVLLDLVPNHTSSAHPWFVEAVSDPGSPHREFYVWADPAADGGPPNNWLAATGASAWTLDEASGQYYLHNFLPSQPDLNWWNPSVHQAFGDILRFWFDRGVAGFRIDVAQGLYKDAQLRDDPPSPEGEVVRGRFGLAQVYSANRPESHGVFRDWRKIAESYPVPRLLLGETWVGNLDALPRSTARGTSCSSRSTSRSSSPRSPRTPCLAWWGRPWRSSTPGSARSGPRPITTSAGSPPAGAAATSAARGWGCSCWPPCPARSSCTTATSWA